MSLRVGMVCPTGSRAGFSNAAESVLGWAPTGDSLRPAGAHREQPTRINKTQRGYNKGRGDALASCCHSTWTHWGRGGSSQQVRT